MPTFHATSVLNTPDLPGAVFASRMIPGAPADDAPVQRIAPFLASDTRGQNSVVNAASPDWLLGYLGGGFVVMVAMPQDAQAQQGLDSLVNWAQSINTAGIVDLRILVVHAHDVSASQATAPSDHLTSPFVNHVLDLKGRIKERYDLTPGAAYLIRPDQHICARWRQPSAPEVEAAYRRALGHLSH